MVVGSLMDLYGLCILWWCFLQACLFGDWMVGWLWGCGVLYGLPSLLFGIGVVRTRTRWAESPSLPPFLPCCSPCELAYFSCFVCVLCVFPISVESILSVFLFIYPTFVHGYMVISSAGGLADGMDGWIGLSVGF